MKINSKKIFIIISFFILNLLFINKVFAATLTLDSSKSIVGIGEQFYVDLMLNPEGQSINAISGSVFYPSENLTFLRAEDGKSMVNLWIEKPRQSGNNINFAGIISSGFEGVIDPFNPNIKLPGLIIRLVFEPKSKGMVEFSTSIFSLNLHDGLGTEISSPAISSAVEVNDFVHTIKYEGEKDHNPQIEAYITHDPNIYNNKYVLVFKASDKGTGIKSVKIKEGRHGWTEIESPYLLKDQSRHSPITLQAMNYGGSGIIINIDKIPYDWGRITDILMVIISIIFILGLIIIKKRHVKNK